MKGGHSAFGDTKVGYFSLMDFAIESGVGKGSALTNEWKAVLDRRMPGYLAASVFEEDFGHHRLSLRTISHYTVIYKRKIVPNLNCGLDLVGEVLYGKWKMRLLWFIDQGHKRPSELQRKIPDASRRVLNLRLRELQDHELVTKVIYPVVPPKVEYSLTDFGRSLIPIIGAIGKWGITMRKG